VSKDMKIPKNFVVFGSILSCALLSFNVQAGPLTYSVSGGSNPAGVFGFLTPSFWNSGDLVLPANTIIDSAPLEVDLTLSQNVTLNNGPSGLQNFSFGMWFGTTPLPAGVDGGTVTVELLENGTVLNTAPTSSPFGFDVGTWAVDIIGYGTGESFTLPNNLVFNGIDVFVTDSAPNGVSVTDLIVGFPIVQAQGVPDNANTLSLLFLGCAAMVGFGYRRVPALCGRVSK
jgi:hypothetical protein